MLDNILSQIRKVIPTPVFRAFQSPYHISMAFLAALWYRFPSQHIKVIAVTGTKGKSSTVEILNAIMEEAGHKTALTNTIRFKVGDESSENLYKMSMPGRFFVQRILRRAVDRGCHYAIIEMTSQGALLHRHRFIELDAFVLTNISPEHIEAHGSYENYVQSKISIATSLAHSPKKNRVAVVNSDDAESQRFVAAATGETTGKIASANTADSNTTNNAVHVLSYSIKQAEPYSINKEGVDFMLNDKPVSSPLSGLFNLYNILAAATTAQSQGVSNEVIIRAVEKFKGIPGRVQKIEAGQDYSVVVDYAHTPDSLEKLYHVFQSSKTICVLGGTGGGRDSWKRATMGGIADKYCDEIILTDEDPYDEDPAKIVADVAGGITSQKPTIIMDRRLAIREAIRRARTGDAVLITGKGTDPYIMSREGSKIPWSDAKIAKEEIEARKR